MKKSVIIASLGILIISVVTVFIWSNRDINRIIKDGPFDRSFSGGIYPYKEEAIGSWFRSVLPVDTTRERAQSILSPSFSVDLTSGKMVVIERESGWAGGQSTEVLLRFEEGKFRDVVIRQQWAYL